MRCAQPDIDDQVGCTAGRELTLDLADFFLAHVSLLPVDMISRGKEVAVEVARLLPDLSSGKLTLAYSRYGIDRLEEAVGRLRTSEAIGKMVLDLGRLRRGS
ncbi:hypothetical protein [Streptomyces sp. NBC_01361]|uniref:hypothetical protein n=1 Tax=Streptomyces sp. NBC_01361 TaxID=2903838 RepID=UPI002E324E8E|nr:hypothetical protein [Streptomyces sp. NBC_01361]